MLLGGPLSVSINFIVDEFLDENLVIVRRTWPQHWGLSSLDGRSWWRLVLDNLQVYTDSLPAAVPLDLVQLVLDLTETVLNCFPTLVQS